MVKRQIGKEPVPPEKKASDFCSECNGTGTVIRRRIGTMTDPDTGEVISYTHPDVVACPENHG